MPTIVSSSRGPLARLLLVAGSCAMNRVDDLIADRHHRVERVHRALEDHRHIAPAKCFEFFLAHRQHISAAEPTSPPVITAGGEHPHDRVGDGRFAAARFAGQSKTSPGAMVKADVVHGANGTASVMYSTCSCCDFEQRGGRSTVPLVAFERTGWRGRPP